MIISYCSQVKNRLYQLKKTIKSNLKHIEDNLNTEWVVMDYGSTDGLYQYMRMIDLGKRIHYYRMLNPISYSIPIAKNMAVRLSSGDYVFNLDIDNFIGNATSQIKNLGYRVGVCCNIFKRGVYGRIGCSRRVFNMVGGYDESFYPAGKHDMDFMERCKLINYYFKHTPCMINPILNSKIETVINTDSNMNWETMNTLNEKKMNYNIHNNIYCPNKKFTSCIFEYNFTKRITLSGEIR
jgi:predicted glycosyltransferase involved in capsule biosynthesis